MPAAYVALLRGINVGGKNTLPMKDLLGIFSESGCENITTYIQSGNVLFDAEPRVMADLPRQVAARIEARFGFRVPVVLRSADAVAAVISNNPFLNVGVSEDALHVYFLADLPDPHRVGELDPNRSTPDRFLVRGKEIYLLLPNGMARTRLTNAYFDSKLSTTSTARNWRTITRLFELMRS